MLARPDADALQDPLLGGRAAIFRCDYSFGVFSVFQLMTW
jgi:hypothetical protein